MIIFKSISPPSLDQFEDLINEVRKQARKAGTRQSDIKNAISKVRRKQ